MTTLDDIRKHLGPLEDACGNPNDADIVRIRLYSSDAMRLEGIPVTELWVTPSKLSAQVRNYGLRTLDDLDTVTRAAALIRVLGLTITS